MKTVENRDTQVSVMSFYTRRSADQVRNGTGKGKAPSHRKGKPGYNPVSAK